MARAPIDYTLDVIDPIQAAMRGYSFGLQEVQAEREEGRAQQRFGMEQERFGMEQERFRTQQSAAAQEAAAQRAQAERQQAFYNDFSRVVRGELPRSELLATYPDFAETMSQTFEMIPDQVAQTRVASGQRIQSALRNNRPDIADNLLANEAEAARNSGNQAYADQLEEMRRQIEQSPRLVFEEIGIGLDAFGAEGLEWAQADPNVQSSELLGGIASVATMRDGTVRVTDARTNEILTGDAAQALLAEARAAEAESRRAREAGATEGRLVTQAELGAAAAGATEAGRSGIELSNATFEAIGPIQSNIGNLNRAIELVEQEGANTGVLASRLPAWRASTIELRNLQNVLGLDVIGSVTFGALSEGELQLALETALPTNLQEDALADWLRRKRDAQQKLVDNLSMRAEFTSIPGNTPGRWMQFTRSGGETFEDMYQWMADNPIRTRGGGQPAGEQPRGEQPRGERPEILEERQFIADMNAKINAGETLTPEEIARLNRIAGQ